MQKQCIMIALSVDDVGGKAVRSARCRGYASYRSDAPELPEPNRRISTKRANEDENSTIFTCCSLLRAKKIGISVRSRTARYPPKHALSRARSKVACTTDTTVVCRSVCVQ